MALRAARGAAALLRVRTRSGSILHHLPPSNSIWRCSRIAARSGCGCVRLLLSVCPCGGLHPARGVQIDDEHVKAPLAKLPTATLLRQQRRPAAQQQHHPH
eukprot:4938602-Prymnesium_polylepis.1